MLAAPATRAGDHRAGSSSAPCSAAAAPRSESPPPAQLRAYLPLRAGLAPAHVAILVALGVIAAGGALVVFDGRDLETP